VDLGNWVNNSLWIRSPETKRQDKTERLQAVDAAREIWKRFSMAQRISKLIITIHLFKPMIEAFLQPGLASLS
jgi:hypothetical protein